MIAPDAPIPTTGSTKNGSRGPLIPMAQWLGSYQRAWLRADLIAGLTVAALVVPKSLGYAGIAQVPIQHGLFAAAAGALIYAVLGTARQISTGPSSALAAVAGSTVSLAAVSGPDAVQIVMAVTMLSGFAYLALAAFRMGWISQFLSKAVITGFLFGAAIEVVVGELRKITGTKASGANTWQTFASWWRSIDNADTATLVVGLSALALIIGLRLVDKRIPGALVLVVGGLIASALFDLKERGVALVGEVPQGLPSLALPQWEVISQHVTPILTAALGLLLIGFSQTAGQARNLAAKHAYRVDINQESFAQGVANVGSSVVQGIPVSTSLSATSLNDSSGAKSPMASVATGATIVLTMLFLAPTFSLLPQPVLAALIIEAVVFGMMDVAAMRRLWHVKREDFWIATITIVAVVSGGVLTGVGVGVLLSLIWLVRVSAQPETPELGRMPDGQTFEPLDEQPQAQRVPGLVALRFDGGLYFVTADALEDRLREVAQATQDETQRVVIDCEGVNFIDSQGSEKLKEIHALGERHGLSVHLVTVKRSILEVLTRDGVVDLMGPERIHRHLADAIPDANTPKS